MSYTNYIVHSLFVFLLFTSPAFAASVSVVPTGNPASFSVEGTGMDGVAGIQLDIAYDASSLANPTVTQGALVSGAMLAANTSRPGTIKIAIISTRPFSGNGQIAAITFASKTGSGGITSTTVVSMIDSKGSSVAASATGTGNSGGSTPVLSNSAGVPFSQTSQPNQTSTTTATTGTTAGTTTSPTLGAVTLPTDMQQRVDSQPAPPLADPVYNAEPPAAKIAEQAPPAGKPVADAKPEETPQYVVYKGISDRFKQYSGSKKLSAVVALFDKKIAQTVTQEPAIVISSGQNKAILTVDIPARIISSPNFAVNGGSLISFKQDKLRKGRWLVDVLPATGSVKVTVTIIVGTEEFEYPLTVAPPVKTALTLDEKGWNAFLKETGTTTSPLHDFNSDGVRNYIDEYIFVANLLANKSTAVKPGKTAK
jgi:hypothetical protein